MTAGALAIVSASQRAGTAKRYVLPPVLTQHFTSVPLVSTYALPYGQESKGLKSFNWPQCPGFLSAGKGGVWYWEPPVSLWRSDFCSDTFPSLFFSCSKLTTKIAVQGALMPPHLLSRPFLGWEWMSGPSCLFSGPQALAKTLKQLHLRHLF